MRVEFYFYLNSNGFLLDVSLSKDHVVFIIRKAFVLLC